MSDHTAIEWTATYHPDGTVTPGATWNPTRGCSRKSRGCMNCYAEREAARIIRMDRGRGIPEGQGSYDGLVEFTSQGPKWTGTIRLVREKLTDPISWRKPRIVFVDSMSDLWHEGVPDEYIDQVFAVMAFAQDHTFIALTKEAERMRRYMDSVYADPYRVAAAMVHTNRPGKTWNAPDSVYDIVLHRILAGLPNVRLGVSAEDQEQANKRVPHLRETRAAVRIISAEPLLGRICLERCDATDGIHQVLAGGESGPDARPMHPFWPRSLRDQCEVFGIAFFFKQWGEWCPATEPGLNQAKGYPRDQIIRATKHGGFCDVDADLTAPLMVRAGKEAAGRLLDGCEHNGQPEAQHA